MNIQFADSNRLLFTILTTLLLFTILQNFFYSIKMQGIFAFVLINIFSFCNILLIHLSKKRLSNLYQNKKFYLVNSFCFLFLIIFIIIKIDYSIYYKWNPEKKILYNSYLLHFITFLILVIFFYLLKKRLLETNKTLKKLEVTPTYNFNKKKWEKNYLLIYAKSN
jgi:CDP-diglyceride synthetase